MEMKKPKQRAKGPDDDMVSLVHQLYITVYFTSSPLCETTITIIISWFVTHEVPV